MKEILDKFIERWGYQDSISPVPENDLEEIVKLSEINFPADYKCMMKEIGPISTTSSLLDYITDNELDIADISEFINPAELLGVTREYIEAGMPEGVILFATDCMGNAFGFDDSGCINFFDHDFCETKSLDCDFKTWLSKYNEL